MKFGSRSGLVVKPPIGLTQIIAVADVLLSRAADLDSDLIVMGAYGHSRAREFALGGTTRAMLERMTVPVLISH